MTLAKAKVVPRYEPGRGRLATTIALGAGLGVAALAAALWLPPVPVGAVLTLFGLLTVFRTAVFSWRGALFGLLGVLLFVPIHRIKVAIPGPIAIEPYRVLLVGIVVAITLALLLNPRYRWQKSEFGAGFAAMFAALVASIAFNAESLADNGLSGSAVSGLFSYVLIGAVFLVTRQLLRSARLVELTLRLIVIGGGIIGAAAVIERVTKVNLFMKLTMIPGLQPLVDDETILRSGGARSFGSAQHPIALSVLLGLFIPLAIYLAKHAEWPKRPTVRMQFYIGCSILMLMGILCTVSRTSVVAILVMLVVGVALRPSLLVRIVFIGGPLGGLAALAAPSAVISMFNSFADPSKLVASQYASAGWRGSGRLADLGPSLAEAATHPFFGTGVGSRIVTGPRANAFILDDQILTTLLETGVVGLLGVLVLMLLPTVRLLRFAGVMNSRALTDLAGTEEGRLRDLACALGVGMAGYVTSMFFFDAFAFYQAIFFFFIFAAIGAWTLQRSRALQAGVAPREANAVLA